MAESLLVRLQAAAGQTASAQPSHPQIFDLTDPQQERALAERMDSGEVRFVHDTLRQQIIGLIETREPTLKLDPAGWDRRVQQHIGGTPLERVGRWVYFPWSQRLVHVLGETEYRELRTSRNRNKVTFAEQEKLRSMKIGIVGLSVGQAAALTLALEEIGGTLRLADFDFLELSNLNRLRAGSHELGVNKAVVAARAIFELNPYARVELFTNGVDDENIDGFLSGLNLVFEECDDLQMKVLVRERARAQRIPVLMETSDRGLMDVERFDLEPDRPIFHGLTGDVRAADLKGLTTYQKVPIVLRIMDQQGISERMAASMVDIETTLKSWPQLASEISLGAGINVDTARRVLLGQFNGSGRFYVDVASIINDEKVRPVTPPPDDAVEISLEAQRCDLPPLARVRGEIGRDTIRSLIAYTTTAFSGGNCQPWKFLADGPRIRCIHDVERSRGFLDVNHHASFLAFGAAAESLELAAKAVGLATRFDFAPVKGVPLVVFDAHLTRTEPAPEVDPLVLQLAARTTNRRLGARVPLPEDARRALQAAADSRGGRLQLLEDDAQLDAITNIIGRSDLLRLLSPVMHVEMMNEFRWTKEEVERTRDGMDIATMEMSATDVAGMRLVRSWSVMKMVGTLGGGWGLQRPTKNAIAAASAVGLVTVPGTDSEALFRGGRAVMRVWLTATACGLAFQPMTPTTYLFDRLENAKAEGFTQAQVAELTAVRRLYRELFDVPAGTCEPMLFRVARAEPATARALRRHVADVLAFQPF